MEIPSDSPTRSVQGNGLWVILTTPLSTKTLVAVARESITGNSYKRMIRPRTQAVGLAERWKESIGSDRLPFRRGV
jgi:hypothetical protein